MPSANATRCCSRTQSVVASLVKTHPEGHLDDRLPFYAKPKPLMMIDELGYLPFEPHAAHLFFQLVSRRYERGNIMITSHRCENHPGSGVRSVGSTFIANLFL